MKAPSSTPSRPPVQRTDWNDIQSLTTAMLETSEELAGMSDQIAHARTIKEFSNDRLKRALAISVREFLVVGDSAASAEVKGKASVSYGEALCGLETDRYKAETVIANFEACLTKWKSYQSALSALRTVAGNV